MARALDELGVPWIEIRALERLAEPGAWSPTEPLDVAHASDQYEWRCDEHRALHATAVAAANAQRAAEREAARHASCSSRRAWSTSTGPAARASDRSTA